jgi:hypothetical protein
MRGGVGGEGGHPVFVETWGAVSAVSCRACLARLFVCVNVMWLLSRYLLARSSDVTPPGDSVAFRNGLSLRRLRAAVSPFGVAAVVTSRQLLMHADAPVPTTALPIPPLQLLMCGVGCNPLADHRPAPLLHAGNNERHSSLPPARSIHPAVRL